MIFFENRKNSQKMWPCVLYCCLLNVVCGFNLDTVNYARLRGQPSSMFGFSVATHRERGRSWVLVGAPEAQNALQPTVIRGGAVYRCSIDSDDSCQEVPFDRKGDNVDNLGRLVDHKSGQWFGATLSSSGEDGPIVACAPRYVYFASKRDRRDPVGTCYVSRNDFTAYSEYSPCRTTLYGYHRQGSCEAGFSAAISKDGRRLFVGGPGSWYWQGQMYSIDAHAKFLFTPGKFSGAYGSGQVIQQSLETRPSVISTKEGSQIDDDSYMGYSVAVGDFTGSGEQGVAVGMPRGAELFGKIVIFTWNLTNHQNLTGEQLGSYFGYALTVGDIDGDGTDDLVIGAPLHTKPNNEGKYEVGRVYVVYQGTDRSKRFRRLNTLDGFNSKSRFGLSLASLGDINLDGFGDFAVGAPYDGPRERGAVYIYHGSKEVIGNKYSQVIFAEDISTPGLPLTTFGFSIAGGVDLDQNDYPDMAVGAYLSDQAYFFRSRPVVKIDAQVRFITANKQIILDEKNCTLLNRQAVTCTSIDICMKFKGVGVPSSIELDLQYVLDAKKTKDPRMYFLSNENRNMINETLSLQKDAREICRQKIVYIKNDIRDKLTPLEAEVRYSMRMYQSSFQQSVRNPRATLLPILDLNSPPVQKDSISVHKNCGADNICIPNLRLIVNSNVERYLLGSNEKLEFDVIVQNEGEDSFESTFDISLPPGVNFNKIVQQDKTEVRILCSEHENNTMRCDIGNPLPAGKIARFTILMTPFHKEGMRPSYDFVMVVNSTNPEEARTVSDNKISKSIHIWVDSKLELGGTSRPSDVHYNASMDTSNKIEKEGDIGPQVIHLYSIKNNGPSSINEAEMLFLWPYATLGGEDLLYLLEQPHSLGNVKCELAEANYKGYELDWRKKSIWESLGIDVSKGDFSSAASQTGGIIIEEGEGTYGSLGSEKVHTKISESDYEQSGDGSYLHQQRRKQQSGGTTSTGTLVHVGEDTGGGSKVRVETHSSSWNQSYGGPVTHTYSRNTTTYVGPDGKIHTYESEYGNKDLAFDTRLGEGTSHSTSGGTRYSQSGYGQSGGSSFSSGTSGTHTAGSTHTSAGSSGGTRYSQSGYGQSGEGSSVSSGTSGTHTAGSTHTSTGSSGGTRYSQSGGSSFSSGTSGTQTGGSAHGSVGSSGETRYSQSGYGQREGSSFSSGTSGTHTTGTAHASAGSTHTSSGSTHSASGSSAATGATQPDTSHYSQGGKHHSHIVYTSSGDKHTGQASGSAFATASSSGSGRIDQTRDYSITGESRQSGQSFNQEEGSRTNFEQGQYPGSKPQVAVTKHFNWNEDGYGGARTGGGYKHDERWSTSGGSRQGGSGFTQEQSGTTYQGGIRNEGAVRGSEFSVGDTRHESGSRHEVVGGTRHTSGGESRHEINVDSRHGTASSKHNSQALPDNYDMPYSSEEYYGSVENQGYDNGQEEEGVNYDGGHAQQSGGSRIYNRTSSWSQHGGSNTDSSGRDRTTYGQYDNRNYEEDYAKHGLGAAAIGHGFHTTSLDLGSIEAAGTASNTQQGHNIAATAHGERYGAQGASNQRGFSSSSNYGSSNQGGNYNQQGGQMGQSSGGGSKWESRSESHWSSSGTGSPPNFGAHAAMSQGRRKRAFDDGDIDIREILECKSTKCLKVRCTVGPLKKDQDAIIAFRSRVNIRALRNISTSQSISFSSMMISRISKLPYIGTPLDRQIHSHEIFTSVPAPEPDIKTDIVPLWVVVLSAVAGTIILLLLIYLLYKCGFFKRNRPSDSPERQPLNRNGYYQNGDAAL